MLRLSSVGELELWHVRMFYMDIYLIRCQAVIIQSESTLEFQFRIFGTAIYHDKYMILNDSIDSLGWYFNCGAILAIRQSEGISSQKGR